MTFNTAVIFILVMTAGVVAITAAIFGGNIIVAFFRSAQPVDDVITGGSRIPKDRRRSSHGNS